MTDLTAHNSATWVESNFADERNSSTCLNAAILNIGN